VQEYRFRSKDGHYLWTQDEVSLLRKADGQPKEIVGFWTILQTQAGGSTGSASAQASVRESELLGSSDRNIAVGSVLAALIISSSFLWGMTITGLTVFVSAVSSVHSDLARGQIRQILAPLLNWRGERDKKP